LRCKISSPVHTLSTCPVLFGSSICYWVPALGLALGVAGIGLDKADCLGRVMPQWPLPIGVFYFLIEARCGFCPPWSTESVEDTSHSVTDSNVLKMMCPRAWVNVIIGRYPSWHH
jgi:hypothetical protein